MKFHSTLNSYFPLFLKQKEKAQPKSRKLDLKSGSCKIGNRSYPFQKQCCSAGRIIEIKKV